MAIPPLAKPDTAWWKAVSRVYARARACVARDKFGKYLSPSPTWPGMPCTKAFRPSAPLNLPSLILHRTFTEPSPANERWRIGEGSASPSRPQEPPANPYLQGLSPSAVKVKVIFCFSFFTGILSLRVWRCEFQKLNRNWPWILSSQIAHGVKYYFWKILCKQSVAFSLWECGVAIMANSWPFMLKNKHELPFEIYIKQELF